MIYFKEGKNEVYKYEITFDLEKVKELLEDLVRDCGIEEKITYLSYSIPLRDNSVIYKTFDYKLVDYKMDPYEVWDIYQVHAIIVKKPYLYDLMEKIVQGNVLALEELFSKRIDMTNKKDEKDLDYYYNAFQPLFRFSLVDKIDLDLYNRVREFMNVYKVEKKSELSLTLNKKEKGF